jgi:hypothetical protein
MKSMKPDCRGDSLASTNVLDMGINAVVDAVRHCVMHRAINVLKKEDRQK